MGRQLHIYTIMDSAHIEREHVWVYVVKCD